MKSKKRFFISILLTCMTSIVFAGNCPKCNGNGRIKTQAGISTYGLDSRKHPCPICGKMISASITHYDNCDLCGGTGNVSDRRGSSPSSNMSADADWLIYLSPDEYNALQENIRALSGRTEYIECGTCNGTGKCNQCGGVFNTNFDDPNRCLFCDGSGYCIACKGRKTIGSRLVKPTEEEKAQILANIKALTTLAEKRRQESFSSSQTSDDYNLHSDDASMQSEFRMEDDSENNDNEDDGYIPYKYIIIGIVIIGGLILYFKD